MRDAVRGMLHVGAIPTIAPFLMPGIVRAFAKRWPDVTVHIEENVTDRLLDRLVNGELDLAGLGELGCPGPREPEHPGKC